MKKVSFKVAKALKETGYWKEQLHEDYPIWQIDATVIRFDTPYGIIGYGMPTYIEVWLWLWRKKRFSIDVDCYNCDKWTTDVNCIEFNDPEEAIINAINYLVDNDLIK